MPWGTPLERFWDKVEIQPGVDGCWVWTGGKKKAGYGQFSVGGHKVIAHRWSYQQFVGPVPPGYEVDHAVCQNESCVRPDHLEAVTLEENRRRRNETRTHCVHGHQYTEESTRWTTDKKTGYTSRSCRVCIRARERAKTT